MMEEMKMSIRIENRVRLQKSIPKLGCRIDFQMSNGYNGIEKYNELQKSIAGRFNDGDSQRFLFR